MISVPQGSEGYVYVISCYNPYGISKAMIAQRAARPRSVERFSIQRCWRLLAGRSIDYLTTGKHCTLSTERFSTVLLTSKKIRTIVYKLPF
jgi:hypothetical protein